MEFSSYAIDRSNGSLGKAVGSYLTGQTFYADVVDNKGKFLYALRTNGVYAFSIQAGASDASRRVLLSSRRARVQPGFLNPQL